MSRTALLPTVCRVRENAALLTSYKMSQLPRSIYKFLKDVIKYDTSKFTITVENSNKKGQGFMGQIYYVSLKDKETGKELHFAVKRAPTYDGIGFFPPIRDVFLNEIYFYTKLWPKLQEFQNRNFEGKKFDKFPKCFGTDSKANSEKLVFENLRHQGFETLDKRRTFDKHHVEFVLKEYGKFHAISVAFRALDPQGYSEISEGLTDTVGAMCDNTTFQGLMKELYKLCFKSLVPGKDDGILEKFKKYVEHGVEICRNNTDYSGKYPVILHGDCWSNNMMFKYDQGGNLVDLRLIDLQMMQQGSAVSDLAYFLYSSSSKEIFNDLNHYLKVYHNSLSDSIRAYGCNPDELYPFEVLKDEWKRYFILGFTMSILVWKSKLTNEADVVDVSDLLENVVLYIETYMKAKYDGHSYRQRTRDIIVHLYENDFL